MYKVDKVDENGYVIQKEGESLKEFTARLAKESDDFNKDKFCVPF